MSEEMHVVFGTGPVGCWIVRALQQQNITVKAVNRTGKRPPLMPDGVEVIAADLSDPQKASDVAAGATVLYQALCPAYHQWQEFFPSLQFSSLAAAKAAGARYISIENLYMYDSSGPISENSPIVPQSKKGQLRVRMAEEVMAAHARGDVQASALRSSDYYGPGVVNSALGDMVFGHLVAGKKAQLTGSATQPHSFAYIEDVGRAAAILGTCEEAPGKVWLTPHAPALTQGAIAEMACRQLGITPKMSVVSPLMMRLAGLFIPEAKAALEMMYEFTAPFVVESKRLQEIFGLEPTPVELGVERTLDWFRGR